MPVILSRAAAMSASLACLQGESPSFSTASTRSRRALSVLKVAIKVDYPVVLAEWPEPEEGQDLAAAAEQEADRRVRVGDERPEHLA